MGHVVSLLALSSLFLSSFAHAQDDDEFDLEDDIPIGTPAPVPTSPTPAPAPDLPSEEGDDDLDTFEDPVDEGFDLIDDDDALPVGDDTDAQYRAALQELSALQADEELVGWEDYLKKFPNSAYKERIKARMIELEDMLYKEKITTGGDGTIDAQDKAIHFAQSLLLENIDPRTRVQFGFEWGLPNYVNAIVDYEHAFKRNLSFHAGFKRRYTGANVETGVKYAVVKSSRTGTLVTLIGDLHFNTTPAFIGIRPQLAVGKRFNNKLDAQIQGGVDFEARSKASLNYIAGFSADFKATDIVGVFVDGRLNMKSVPSDAAFESRMFSFNVITFGFKFRPQSKKGEQNTEVNMGATVPVMQQYWQFHYGSIAGQFNYEL